VAGQVAGHAGARADPGEDPGDDGRPAAPPGGGPGSLRGHEHQGEIADDGGDEGVTVTGIRGPGAAACLVLLIPRDGRPMPFGKILFSTERTVVFVTWVCSTCGNHFPDPRPGTCAVCADERQWLPPGGQRRTTLAELAAAGHRSDVREVEPGLTGIGAEPPFAIGQRSLLVRTPAGNLLWDPSGFIDAAAVAAVRDAGGLSFVTASHPHFYGSIAEWAREFGAEILVPEADAGWLRAGADAQVRTWSGTLGVLPGVTLIQCGGHFPGSAVVTGAASCSAGTRSS
jgi:hypothetical protein